MDLLKVFKDFAVILITILQFAIIGRAIISWFPLDPGHPLVRVLVEVTEPILAPLRRILPRTGMIDIAPMVAIIVLLAIQTIISGLPSGG
ncbi:MAG: YggT family protein [Dehalococcoidia bacterium]